MFEAVTIGQCITYVDPHGVERDALVTNLFGWGSKLEQDEHYREVFNTNKEMEWCTDQWLEQSLEIEWSPPSVNCVFVSLDSTQTDPYGRQLAQRATSIVYQSKQSAHGNYWKNKEK